MLKPNETEIIDRWISEHGQMKADEACAGIEHLTKNVLVELGVSQYSAWETLYQDPTDDLVLAR